MDNVKWNEQFKVRIANPDESMMKHDIIKMMVVRKLLLKYRKDKNFLQIYTEFSLDNNDIVDVYFSNSRDKVVYIFEIQKNMSKEWLDNKTIKYKDYEVPFMTSTNWIPIPLNKLSNDLDILSKELDSYIF